MFQEYAFGAVVEGSHVHGHAYIYAGDRRGNAIAEMILITRARHMREKREFVFPSMQYSHAHTGTCIHTGREMDMCAMCEFIRL